jgi:branched-chain amino acid transport system ATP-binding protein
LSKTKDFEVARLGISRTFQDVRLFKNLTIKDHLEIAMSKRDEDLFTNLLVGEKVSVEKIKAVLDLVGLEKSLSTYAVNLSYGQRKLLDLAVAIAKKHTILMLDEPVAGVNPLLRNKIKEIIKSLNEKGETVLLIEHDMNFVMNLADHIFVMDAGRVIAEGKPEEIQNNKKVLDAYLGE